jgi:hypothetical protein
LSAAVSSIFKAEQFREQQEALNAVEALGPSAVNLHISSKLTTTQRKRLMREFPTYERALMTNARCLTEGVDIPAIDCVVFADRKNSTVDIVQAAGRAMRTAPGKDKGYILIPLVVDDDVDAEGIETLAKTSGFREVARIVTALSTNDERIVEQFRVIYDGDKIPSGGGIIKFDGSVRLGLNIEFDRFADAIQTKIWERVARGNWRPFAEARAFVRTLKLKSNREWSAYCLSGQRPADVPADPLSTYADVGWAGMGDWLGTGTLGPQDYSFRPFAEARSFVHTLKLKTDEEWSSYCKSGQKPDDIPRNARSIYANDGWAGMGDWLGTGTVAPQDREYRPFVEARAFVRTLKLKNQGEWRAYCRSGQKPSDIPTNPSSVYANDGWTGWGDWLGTGTVANQDREFLPFAEARAFVHALKLKNRAEWWAYCKSGQKPGDIPAYPNETYGEDGWVSMGDWLGTGTVASQDYVYRAFAEARSFVRTLNLKKRAEWLTYCKSRQKPDDIPADPSRTYANNGWAGWGDWLGTGTVRPQDREYRPFVEARAFVHDLKLKSKMEWTTYCKSGQKPADIPASPRATYADDGWVGWGDWLGTGTLGPQDYNFRPFVEARAFVHALKLKNRAEWWAYCKSGQKPGDIPAYPNEVYEKDGWAGMGDWLGTGKKRGGQRKSRGE